MRTMHAHALLGLAGLLVLLLGATFTDTQTAAYWSTQGKLRVGGSGGIPATRVIVAGDADTRIQIDGTNTLAPANATAGIYLTRNAVDAGTIRATVAGIEIWPSSSTIGLRIER